MKTKIIEKASALLLTLIIALSFTLAAFADSIFIPNAGTGVEHVYIFDETKQMTAEDKKLLAQKMTEVYNLTNCDIGFFLAAENRHAPDIVDIAKNAADDIYYSFNTSGAFIIYLDCTGRENAFCYMHASGNAHKLVPNGDNSDYDAAQEIMYRSKHTFQPDENKSASENLRDRAVFVCDSIMLYIDSFADFVSADMEEWSSASTSSSGSSSNPDSYILESSTFRSNYSSNSTGSDMNTYTTDRVTFTDESNLFSQAQALEVLNMFDRTAGEIEFNLVLFAAGKSRSDSSVESRTRSLASTVFPNSSYTGTVCLYIDLDGYTNAYDYMFCYNDAFLYYTNGDDFTEDRIKKILHAMQAHFPAGGQEIVISDIISGLEEYCKQLVKYKAKGLVEGTYYTDPKTREYVYASGGKILHSNMKPYIYWWIALLIGLAVGAIVAAVTSISVKRRYKFKSSTSASVYTSKEKIFMRHSQDVFIGSHVSKVRLQSSSGGHGGHGGGHHVGGGGGGSHR